MASKTARLWTITEARPGEHETQPVSPCEVLAEEFLESLGMSKYRLAKETGVPAQRIGEILAGRRAITADTDLRLCRSSELSYGWCASAGGHDTEVA